MASRQNLLGAARTRDRLLSTSLSHSNPILLRPSFRDSPHPLIAKKKGSQRHRQKGSAAREEIEKGGEK
jgi:hypothetical protein